jgi:hypothetical protein
MKLADPLSILQELIGRSSLRKVALTLDVSAAYLSDVMRGNRPPGPKVLKALGLRRVVTKQVQYFWEWSDPEHPSNRRKAK